MSIKAADVAEAAIFPEGRYPSFDIRPGTRKNMRDVHCAVYPLHGRRSPLAGFPSISCVSATVEGV